MESNSFIKGKQEPRKLCRFIAKHSPELRVFVVFIALVVSAYGCSEGEQEDNAAKNSQKDSHAAKTSIVDKPFRVSNAKIAFVSERDGNPEVYAMDADGSELANLTRSPATDDQPAFSPEGRRIAFGSDRDGNFEVYAMNADGTGQTRLTNDPAYDGGPLFSPERSGIAFVSDRDGDEEIYSMYADGSHQERLTNNSANDGPISLFEGKGMAFASDRDGDYEIYSMDADGSHQEQLTDNAVPDFWPAFPSGQRTEDPDVAEAITAPPPTTTAASRDALVLSNPILITDDLPYYPTGYLRIFTISPEGDKVAFVIGSGAHQGIHVIKSDGSPLASLGLDSLGLTSLEQDMMAEGQPISPPEEPIFSPDGDKIVFSRPIPKRHSNEYVPHQWDLYTVRPDGTALTNITSTDSAFEQNPVFSVDGAKMAFVGAFVGEASEANNGREIYTMDPDGTNRVDLTDSANNDLQPAFSSKEGKIAFASNRGDITDFDIYAMDSDGTNQTRLTMDAHWDDFPTFSPGGKKVAFTRRNVMSGDDSDIYLVNVDGTGLTRLTHFPAPNNQPAFIPRTDMLAFVSPRDGDDDIYALKSDSTGLTNLTSTDSASETAPTFSADGTKMAYASARRDESGKMVYEIYVATLDNTN